MTQDWDDHSSKEDVSFDATNSPPMSIEEACTKKHIASQVVEYEETDEVRMSSKMNPQGDDALQLQRFPIRVAQGWHVGC